ncbi:Uncharacterised protein [Segatella copri]|nr:Uncharacterised protein [Segatella copri]
MASKHSQAQLPSLHQDRWYGPSSPYPSRCIKDRLPASPECCGRRDTHRSDGKPSCLPHNPLPGHASCFRYSVHSRQPYCRYKAKGDSAT